MTAIVLVPLVWGCATPKEEDDQTVVIEALGDLELQAAPGDDHHRVAAGGDQAGTIGGDPPRLPDYALYALGGMGGGEDVAGVRGRGAVVPVVPAVHQARRSIPPVSGGVEQWRGLVAAYFPSHLVDTVLRIIDCESSGSPTAYNAGNYGLLQINAVHQARVGGNLEALYDPETNVRVARDIWRDNSGFGPWACY